MGRRPEAASSRQARIERTSSRALGETARMTAGPTSMTRTATISALMTRDFIECLSIFFDVVQAHAARRRAGMAGDYAGSDAILRVALWLRNGRLDTRPDGGRDDRSGYSNLIYTSVQV